MIEHDTGTLVLKVVPSGKIQEEVGAFLANVFKNVSREKVMKLVSKAPVVVSKNVPAKAGSMIVSGLEKLGATAAFVPKDQATEDTVDP